MPIPSDVTLPLHERSGAPLRGLSGRQRNAAVISEQIAEAS
jgi:hypothetical protein